MGVKILQGAPGDAIVMGRMESEQDTRKEAASRNDAGKIRFDLLPADSLVEVAKLFTVGSFKYADRNWEKGMSWSRCIRAIFSHTIKFMMGERYDDGPGGTGCHHMACVVWNAMVLCSYDFRGAGNDDRVKLPLDVLTFRPYDLEGFEKAKVASAK